MNRQEEFKPRQFVSRAVVASCFEICLIAMQPTRAQCRGCLCKMPYMVAHNPFVNQHWPGPHPCHAPNDFLLPFYSSLFLLYCLALSCCSCGFCLPSSFTLNAQVYLLLLLSLDFTAVTRRRLHKELPFNKLENLVDQTAEEEMSAIPCVLFA